MKKLIKLALAGLAVAASLASCQKDGTPSQKELETKIIGKWKLSHNDGKESLTNSKAVWTFGNNEKGTVSLSMYIPDAEMWMWLNRASTDYQISGNNITLSLPTVKHFISVGSVNDRKMELTIEKSVDNRGQKADNITARNCSFTKITADCANDILGIWEGVEMTGDETYGNAQARILYRADGTYIYYRKYADVWFPSDDVCCEFNVDGDWLATRWQAEEGGEYKYEWWDIDEIRDGRMKWSALRERADGSRYSTTFTWKKVDMLVDDELLAKAKGDWNNIGTRFYFFKDGELVGTEDKMPVGEQTYSVFDGNKYRIIELDDDGQPYVVLGGSWTVRGTIITSVIEECQWPEVIGMEDRSVMAILNDEFMAFGFYEDGECYIADEDTPEYDHWLQLTRYQRK